MRELPDTFETPKERHQREQKLLDTDFDDLNFDEYNVLANGVAEKLLKELGRDIPENVIDLIHLVPEIPDEQTIARFLPISNPQTSKLIQLFFRSHHLSSKELDELRQTQAKYLEAELMLSEDLRTQLYLLRQNRELQNT
jgi:hypothetical protein